MKKYIYIFIVFLFSSCGFYSFTGASISPEIKTVSVDYFQNKASIVQPILSQLFTEKLKDYFVLQTNLELEDSNGDLSFSGVITHYQIKPIAIQANETARQNRLTIKIKVVFKNKYDTKLDFSTTFSRYRDFSSDENLNSIEETLIEEICNELVEDVFNKAVVNW